MSVERIKGLDALRGLMAFSVMIYHCASWSDALAPGIAGNALAKLGIYAVESFYVLSGFSLMHAYGGASFGERTIVERFFWKRVMRLWPLFAVAVGLQLARGEAQAASWLVLLGNFTLLFGFVDPAVSVVTGGWSIGLEMVFYAVFAATLWLRTRLAAAVTAATAVSLLAALPWAIWVLHPEAPLARQWPSYVAVPNHLFLFCCGMLLCQRMTEHRSLQRGGGRPWLAGIGLALAFCAIAPVTIDEIRFVTGATRIALAFVCVAAVAVFARAQLPERRWARALQRLGEISYGVYLIHPFALWGARYLPAPELAQIAVAVVLTLVVASASYYQFEVRFTRIALPFRAKPLARNRAAA